MQRFTLALIALVISLPALAATPNPFAHVEITRERLRDHVFVLYGAGGNIGASIGEDGTLLIDDQFAPLAEKILAALDAEGGNKPRIILNTHHHSDHVGGNAFFGRDGIIISHENVRARLSTSSRFSAEGLPHITYEDELVIHFNGDELTLMHMPHGHTDGDTLVWFKGANVVHLGDHFFNGSLPFIDVGGGGSLAGYIQNLEYLLDRLPEDIVVIPGHGPVGTLTDIAASVTMAVETKAIINQGLLDGLSDEAIAKNLRGYESWAKRSTKIDDWVRLVKSELLKAEA
ncbi:MAG: MBL fold metallo-hydrolase [OM182 bacterium]|nr:MAG: MBL fold metallo-hydrolase [OM182 bacterium]